MSACYQMVLVERKVIAGEGEERLYEVRCHLEKDVIGYVLENVEGDMILTYVAKEFQVPRLIGRNDTRAWERAYRLLRQAIGKNLSDFF